HEIRNPLAGVKGAAQFLQHDPGLGDESKEMLQIIVDETDRLNEVVSNFLDYARPFELRLAPDPLNDLVERTSALVHAQGLPDGVDATLDLAEGLPIVPLDAARMSQVMLNLVRNAIQAMPSGGALGLRTRVGRDRTGRRGIEVLVSDTGAGIEPDVLGRLFVPFFTTKSDGTGLGLAICQRIVQAHGGSIDVTSSPGRGTTFLVFLPLPVDPPTQTEEEAR
ncbi:MAG: histidine kinase, partial [Myxococcales bacterium]|nr:histidine kinase [Myxococcales bacterium]